MAKVHMFRGRSTPLCGTKGKNLRKTDVNEEVTCITCLGSMRATWGVDIPPGVSPNKGGRKPANGPFNVWDKFEVRDGLFDGKTRHQWEVAAKKIAIEYLVASAMDIKDQSAVGYISSQRLLQIAKKESPELFEEVLRERAEWDDCLPKAGLFWSAIDE